MADIIPAILETTVSGLEKRISEALKIPKVKRIQMDISDGEFTPTKTVLFEDIEILNPTYLWEAHLMVKNPKDYILDAKIAGFAAIAVHFEAVPENHLESLAEEIHSYKMEAILAVNPETSVPNIMPYIRHFNSVMLMSVKPGLQGQQFIEDTYERVQMLRQGYPHITIEVDGGVSMANAKRLVQAGANYLVVGSALRSEPDKYSVAQNFERIQSETLSI